MEKVTNASPVQISRLAPIPLWRQACGVVLCTGFLLACGGGSSTSGGGAANDSAVNPVGNDSATVVTGNDSMADTIRTPGLEPTTSPPVTPTAPETPTAPVTPSAGDLDPAPADTMVVGPNLNGYWSGYFSSEIAGHTTLTATIRHTGNYVVIETSRPPGIAHRLSGTIEASGDMTMIDNFNGQTWTTLLQPSSGNSIRLNDYVFVSGELEDLHTLRLRR